ncbi:DUF4197 domain-containing protein [Psychroflexus maritimus]|uniref:DUF4197 domain-containing protein n=1 Tax=Psychroflexus maritimus TaxID=2714865 RepID=A0A967DXK0_9FLAO|nr:DUF4197 domain-containing protein [Psychroflexus maritimus]NGZ88760.1 DUF4197 domain-containing protein [Psychroflexus maritimus]
MKKTFFLLCLAFTLSSCDELQQIANEAVLTNQSDSQISSGLKQALELGVERQVKELTAPGGFFQNEEVRILLPEELRKVETALRRVGLNNLADEGLIALNATAEDAVKEATPIFVNAIKNMSIQDAQKVLMGNENAATQFLERQTSEELYASFYPVVEDSFQKVGADEIWSNLISKYNNLPLTSNVTTDLSDYITQQAMQGVFIMIAKEEKEIRNNAQARTTDLLRRVFSLQD